MFFMLFLMLVSSFIFFFFFFQAEDGIRDATVTGVQTCALPIYGSQGGIVVNPAEPSTFVLTGFPSTTTSGDSWNFGVTAAYDAYGNRATNYTEIGRASCRERV